MGYGIGASGVLDPSAPGITSTAQVLLSHVDRPSTAYGHKSCHM